MTLVLGATVFCLAPPSDPDVWWHVRTGHWILDHRTLPSVDPWSLTAAGRPWVAHSWLAEVLLAVLHGALGLKGLIAFRAVGVFALLTSLSVQAFRRTTPGRALLVTTLAVLATRGGWGERPQLLSFVLLVVAAQLVRSAHAGRRNIWWVVPLTYLWANVHGLWFLAPLLTALGAFGVLTSREGPTRFREAARFGLAAVASVVVAGLTPNGPALLAQPFKVNAYGQFVSEWDAPSLHSVYGLAFFLMIIALVVAYARRETPASLYEVAQVVFAVLFGLMYARTVAPGAVLLAPLLAESLAAGQHREPRAFPRAFTVSFLALLCVGAVAGGALVLSAEPSLPPGAPVAATRALVAAAPGEQRVINEYGIGGWLLLFAPTARPAIDGRAEIYPLSYVADYYSAIRMNGDWRRTIESLHADVALLHPRTALVNGLRDELGWHAVYQDASWIVLVPRKGSTR